MLEGNEKNISSRKMGKILNKRKIKKMCLIVLGIRELKIKIILRWFLFVWC